MTKMENQSTENTAVGSGKRPAGRRLRSLAIGTVAIVSAVGVGYAIAGPSGPMGGSSGGGSSGMHGWMHGGEAGHGMMEGRGMRGGARMERMFDAIDATPEQRETLSGIMDSAREEMGTVFQDMRGTHEAMVEILTAPEIDRDAAEDLRAERVAAMEAASHRMLETMLDAAEVLTPQQRSELAELMQNRGHWRGDGNRGGRRSAD